MFELGHCKFAETVLVFITILMILVASASASDGGLNLPSGIVNIEVIDGAQSYFDTTLSEVPGGYDVANATYPGWCVDFRTDMARSPAIHAVFLYSSTSPPGELANENWGAVNYILNHKQGGVEDIQQAIWYFIPVEGNYTPSRPTAWAIINDTLENGVGFIPGPGQTIAVICYPIILFPGQAEVQISIIEVGISNLPWDINGDGFCNSKDAIILGSHFGTQIGEPNYFGAADINIDGYIDSKDAVILGAHFGEAT